jgi:hypothetical protein
MGLQVRLRHTLGERLLELPERPVDEPVVVGRASTADVQVPSVNVATRHCVLFAHDGLWAVQEMPGTTGTFVNGAKVEGPTPLHVGDLITLGPEVNAPRMEIDPLGAAQGRMGHPAGGRTAAPAAPAPAQPASAGYSEPAGAIEVAPSPVAAAAWPHPAIPAEELGGGGDTIAWPADGAAPSRYSGRRRRRQSDSGLPVGILLTLLIAGGVGYFIYQHRQPSAQVTGPIPSSAPPRPPLPTTRREEDTSHAPESIFDKMNPRAPGKAGTRPATRNTSQSPLIATAPPAGGDPAMAGPDTEPSDTASADAAGQDAVDAAPASTAPASASTPSADDPAWKQVQAAHYSQDEAKAILKFDDYAQSHPDQNAAQLTEYTDAAMDRIWFERIEQLCRQREELTRQIQQTEKETAEETDEAYKKRVLIPLKQKYINQLQSVEEALTKDMRYEGSSAPNLVDDAEIDKLRRQRDPAYYAGWKSRVLAHIRRTHGELPWASS